ncbi:SusC/RagA family TonB-linked outer membrane protein [Mucilaginibacter paludis]|uniref:TonB-dependent receptor plug n=1 Tax=Mucilaginibacter paludis DSM 18603 TaxID=714943 RepID=H1YFR4_9SPHI|nr:SusC/RagA family TonB-linked outer membrane protein [Mucilaginibacter paludis]EHQ24466.1 TonB-dependent receptor plug [Mucilaginibacter paludis DSM 18603]
MIIIKNIKKRFPKGLLLVLLLFFYAFVTHAQNRVTIRGTVTDKTGDPIIGAVIAAKADNAKKVLTDKDGKFEIAVPANNTVIIISSFGMGKKEITASVNGANNIVLEYEVKAMNEVVVVGYGQQRKASIVGSITQTSGKELERTGGVTNLGMALTGNLPGVVVTSSTGMPGGEDPQIVIRGISSWNSSSPLILVDGIERSISSIDISSVESVSVLKDASATAVYGVRGANGVILVTTKRGVEGKAQVQARSNITTKVASKLPAKYDSYDALMIKNKIIERESIVDPNAWSGYTPMATIYKYRYPANTDEWDRYPNVDWEKELFKDRAMSYNSAVNVSGGSKYVNYFAGIDITKEGDLFKTFPNNRGYDSNFGYTRMNFRSNLDFNLTKTTKFSTNLFGSNAVRQLPYGLADGDQAYWSSAYRTAPDTFRPIYSDGTYGYYPTATQDQPNAAFWLAYSGVEKRTTTQLTTDFILQQQLSMVTKGLSFRGSLSLDNTFVETGRGINDQNHPAQRKYINPSTGQVTYEQLKNTGTQFDFTEAIAWTTQGGSVNKDATYRNMNYQFQLNYARPFGGNNVTAMAMMQRQRGATGSAFPRYREDWVFRVTYNYKQRYLFEANGAYNGSEKFGPDYRFAFFPSLSAGWSINNESFMKNVTFVDVLKVRGSWGRIGDDNVGGSSPWLFRDSYSYGGNAMMGSPTSASPYTIYRVSAIGNPNISWETAEKRNLGLDFGFLHGDISGNVDVFNDRRTRIMIGGTSRAIPSFFGYGSSTPQANLGEVTSKGYEVELKFNHSFSNGIRAWVNLAKTHATNKTIFRDDPELTPAYQKQAGYAIGQTKSYIDHGFITSWDDLYGSTTRSANNQNRLPGDYNIVDFNGDGVIDDKDQAPYGYTATPQNTYNATIGFEWKRLSLVLQFYGVNNVTRYIEFPDFQGKSNVVFVEKPFWYKQSGGGEVPPPRWSVLDAMGGAGTRYYYDASYIRLKNAEIGYTIPGKYVSKLGLRTCRFYVNGNNLLLWTKMPDDRESNFSGNSSGGAYPTVRRYNLGIDITL